MGTRHTNGTDRAEAEDSEPAGLATPIFDALTTALIAGLRDAVMVTDATGRIVHANLAAERLAGLHRHDLAGRRLDEVPALRALSDAVPVPEFADPVSDVFDEELPGAGPRKLFVSHHAAPCPLEYRTLPYRGAESRGTVHILRDLSEEVQTELAVASKLAAEDESRAKSALLTRVSREIRSPVDVILSELDRLRAAALDDDERAHLDSARSAGEGLLGTLSDLVDLVGIEGGQVQLDAVDFRLLDPIEDSLEAVAVEAEAKGIALESTIGPDVPRRLRGDPRRLRQLLSNLLSNAVHFTDSGRVEVRVAIERTIRRSTLVRFEVEDTGVGLPPEVAERLFASPGVGGAPGDAEPGLGLAICRQLSTLMGGAIGVESEPGNGSLFWFTAQFDTPPSAPRGE